MTTQLLTDHHDRPGQCIDRLIELAKDILINGGKLPDTAAERFELAACVASVVSHILAELAQRANAAEGGTVLFGADGDPGGDCQLDHDLAALYLFNPTGKDKGGYTPEAVDQANTILDQAQQLMLFTGPVRRVVIRTVLTWLLQLLADPDVRQQILDAILELFDFE